MRYPRIAGLCLASMLAMSMALAGSAAAEEIPSLWLVCLEGTGLTKYENSKCLKASGASNSSKGWQSLGVPAGNEITVKLLVVSILLIDKNTKFGEVRISCDDPGSVVQGIIKAGGGLEIRKFEYPNAKEHCSDEADECTKVDTFKGTGLPWVSKLVFVPGFGFLAKIEPHPVAEAQPGWEFECEDEIGLKLPDKCISIKGQEEKFKLVNTVSANELLVLALFENVHLYKCSDKGGETGEVKGSIAILLPGGALSITQV